MRSSKFFKQVLSHLREHPELLNQPDGCLARELKRLGFYSKKTYYRDIRVWRLREALKKGAPAG